METAVSPETRSKIYADEGRLLLRGLLVNLVVPVGALMLWAYFDRHLGSPLFLLVGFTSLPVAMAAVAWWRHRALDPMLLESERSYQTRSERLDREAADAERFAEHPPRFTQGLIAVVVGIGMIQFFWAGSIARAVEAAGLVKPAVSDGQWWRLVSATYLHAGPYHLWANMTALFMLGRLFEAHAPRWRLPLAYAAAGVVGSLASWWLLPGKPSLGASGAVMGLAGYLLVQTRLRPREMPAAMTTHLLTLIGATAYIGAFGFSIIDNAAHAGGFVAGAAIALWSLKRGEQDQQLLNVLGVLATVCLMVGAGGTVYALRRASHRFSAETVVTSASASLHGTKYSLTARVKNDRDQPLEAYRLEIVAGGRIVETAWRDDCCFSTVSADSQPVLPHSTDDFPLSMLELRMAAGRPSVRITLAIFADGSYEGRAREYDVMLKQRQWVADDADYWLQAIAEDRSKPHKGWHDSLLARMDVRAALSDFGRPSATVLSIREIAALDDHTPGGFAAGVDRRVASITHVRDELRRRIERSKTEKAGS